MIIKINNNITSEPVDEAPPALNMLTLNINPNITLFILIPFYFR